MLFFIHGRDRAGVADLLDALSDRHWTYLDGFADRLVARGPTLSDDGTQHTGSTHVVDLPIALRHNGLSPRSRSPPLACTTR